MNKLRGSKMLLHLIKFSKKSYNDEIAEGYFLEDDAHYPENFYELYQHLPFLSQRKKIGKVEDLLINLHDKSEYLIHIRYLKQTLNNGLILNEKTVDEVIKF